MLISETDSKQKIYSKQKKRGDNTPVNRQENIHGTSRMRKMYGMYEPKRSEFS